MRFFALLDEILRQGFAQAVTHLKALALRKPSRYALGQNDKLLVTLTLAEVSHFIMRFFALLDEILRQGFAQAVTHLKALALRKPSRYALGQNDKAGKKPPHVTT